MPLSIRSACGSLLLLVGIACGVPPSEEPPPQLSLEWQNQADGQTFAVVINGGSDRRSNYQSHLLHVRELLEYLGERGIPRSRIWVFSSDGENPAADLAVRRFTK